jgi:hypothetical protein
LVGLRQLGQDRIMRLLCIACRCEVERVEIARGRVVAVCVACEAYGDAAEMVAGVQLTAAEPVSAVPKGWRRLVETAKRFNAPVPSRLRSAGASRTR